MIKEKIRTAHLALTCTIPAMSNIALLHLLPAPKLYATNNQVFDYKPWNFLSEFARTQYGIWMTLCFILMGTGALSLGLALHTHRLKYEAILIAIAAIALFGLAVFPTDLADLRYSHTTCGLPTRIEPCTLVGRIHNPLSTFVFAPIALMTASLIWRSRKDFVWKPVARAGVFCGVLALLCVVGAKFYLHNIHWQGASWTGLMQRSLVLPALLYLTYLSFFVTYLFPRPSGAVQGESDAPKPV
jgi:hypothetical protein